MVETAISTTLEVVAAWSDDTLGRLEAVAQQGGCLVVTLCADNDFYSQQGRLRHLGLPPTTAALATVPRFSPCTAALGVGKTGLGSSAALTTSVTAALLRLFDVVDSDDPGANGAQGQRYVHNLAQIAHSLSQNKVGSGFDVSAATFGGLRYRRFPKDLLAGLVGGAGSSDGVGAHDERRTVELLRLVRAGDGVWTNECSPFALPAGLELMLADVCGGSATTSMVSRVNKWRASSPEVADAMWAELAASNARVEAALADLASLAASKDAEEAADAAAAVATCSSLPAARWAEACDGRPGAGGSGSPAAKATVDALTRAREAFLGGRHALRRLTQLSGVPVEPPLQTALADATMAVPGVLLAGVPGAGGHDAVFAVLLGAEPRRRVEALWASSNNTNGALSSWMPAPPAGDSDSVGGNEPATASVCPLLSRQSSVGEGAGLRFHRGWTRKTLLSQSSE